MQFFLQRKGANMEKTVLRSNERGKQGCISLFPSRETHGYIVSFQKEWEEIALLYHGGAYARTFGEKRLEKMIELVLFLVDNGDFFAKNLLAVISERGDMGLPKNESFALDLYREVALSGKVPVAWFNLGMLYWRRGCYHNAIESFVAGRDLGCSFCEARLFS